MRPFIGTVLNWTGCWSYILYQDSKKYVHIKRAVANESQLSFCFMGSLGYVGEECCFFYLLVCGVEEE